MTWSCCENRTVIISRLSGLVNNCFFFISFHCPSRFTLNLHSRVKIFHAWILWQPVTGCCPPMTPQLVPNAAHSESTVNKKSLGWINVTFALALVWFCNLSCLSVFMVLDEPNKKPILSAQNILQMGQWSSDQINNRATWTDNPVFVSVTWSPLGKTDGLILIAWACDLNPIPGSFVLLLYSECH